MSHPEARLFIELMITKIQAHRDVNTVFEVGSYDVNGAIRGLFKPGCEYLGVDLVEGPSVDMVASGHEVSLPDNSFDLSVSTECFEHDPHWNETFSNMVRLTKPGGFVVFTCASSGRPEHGTLRSNPSLSPGTSAMGSQYYRNLTDSDFSTLTVMNEFQSSFFFYNPVSFDLYFAGQLRSDGAADDDGQPSVELSLQPEEILALRSRMSLIHRVVRWPLRVMFRKWGESPRYQEKAVKYWVGLDRAQGRIFGSKFNR